MKGMKVVVKILKILGATIGSFILLVGIGVALLNTTSVQQKLLQKATTLLAEHLETKVEIDSLRIGFFSDDVRLIGLRIDDRQQRRMLQIDYLGAELKMWKLARKEVYISEVTVRGIKAALYKPSPDEPANYQFVLDAFKKKPSKETQDSLSQGKKPSPLVVNLKKATVEDAEVIYNENAFSFQKAQYKKGWLGKQAVSVHRLKASWEHVTKKKQVHVDDRLVQPGGQLLRGEDNAVLGTVESIAGTEGHHVCIGDRGRHEACGHQSCILPDVHVIADHGGVVRIASVAAAICSIADAVSDAVVPTDAMAASYNSSDATFSARTLAFSASC